MPYLGVVLNLLVVSAPLFFIEGITLVNSPVVLIFYCLVSIFCFLESQGSVYSSYSMPESGEKALLPYFASISLLIVLWVSLYSYAQGNQYYNPVQLVIASMVTITGVWLRVLSIKALNQFFVSHLALNKQHQLIKSGLYSVVRHPSELGLILICLGISLLTTSVYGLCATLLLILPTSIYRVLLEDKMISDAFGTDFINYQSSVPALIPHFIQRKKTC